MTTEALDDGQISSGLRSFVDAGSDYLNEIALGLAAKLTDADLLEELRGLDAQLRSIEVAWHALIAQVEQRGLPHRVAASSTSALLQSLLQLSPYEANRRVSAARLLGPRLDITGQPLEPLLPSVAAAQRESQLSAEHARVIGKVLDRVPGSVPVEDFRRAEEDLVAAARQLRPREVGHVGERILAYLDPDGVFTSDAEHQRRRSFTLVPMSDGSYRASGYLTPACGAELLAALNAFSAPQPSAEGVPDPRPYCQRMHDGLNDLAEFCLRRSELVDATGAMQLVITMTADQWATRRGCAETSFGQLMDVPTALELADETNIALVLRDAKGAVLAEGRTKRIATRAQTLALIARDKGCSFPGCDRPPEWCQRHHVIPWIDDGPTDVDNLTLVCGHHHRQFERTGWRCVMRDGRPWWIPPAWLDLNQEPQINRRIQRV